MFSVQLMSLEQRVPTALRRTYIIGYGDNRAAPRAAKIDLEPGQSASIDGLTALHYLRLDGTNIGPVRPNQPLVRLSFAGADDLGPLNWVATPANFEDIWIYDNRLYFIGGISEQGFNSARKRHPAWGPNETWDGNGPHRETDLQGLLSRRSFCYQYPPTFQGGTQNPNYYCLPQDLETMDTMVDLLAP
jgi:hypothetical protein